jgi:hypothetical protein
MVRDLKPANLDDRFKAKCRNGSSNGRAVYTGWVFQIAGHVLDFVRPLPGEAGETRKRIPTLRAGTWI